MPASSHAARRRGLILVIAATLFVALGSACVGIANPDGWAPPAETDDALYVSRDGGEMSALDPATYDEIWVFPKEDEFACGDEEPAKRDLRGIYEAPALDDERLYISAYDDAVYAVNRTDGTCAWRFATDDPNIGAPVLGDVGLYVASTDGTLYVLDPETGEQTDSFAAGDIWSTPLLTEDALYLTTMEGQMWKLDPATLDPIWDAPFDVDAGLLTQPVLVGETVVAGGIGGKLYGVNAATGEEQWSVGGAKWFWGTPTAVGTTVYATTLGKEVMAVDVATGNKLWTAKTMASVRSGPVVTGNLVVAVDNDGNIYRLDTVTGQEASGPSQLETSVYASPIVASDDKVLIVARNGDVFSFDPVEGRSEKVKN